ncbi:MAG: 2,3-bisphosphoglycerate-independent phosphoglycerate mutase [Crocinitomix sp.]|nr:2,3-bisphosphoglycerate-independent phosphoglycerate mutase [Crocinitomix sp.]
MKKKVALIILDGWGNGDKSESDAIFNAKTPFIDHLKKEYPTAELLTHGEHVGLPEGQMGNSEVGHLNIGAGRVVYQDLTRINKSIADGEFQKNEVLLEAFKHAKQARKPVHFIGLVSTGGVHSSQEHLHTLCDMAKENGLSDVFIHAFTDGRDCDPMSGLGQITNLEKHLETSVGKIASVMGRYYAMDRDNRWDRIKLAYDCVVNGRGEQVNSATKAIQLSYNNGITDEFISPKVLHENGKPIAKITAGDVVICFNYRTDRCRQLTTALTQKNFPEKRIHAINLHYCTMTNYDKSFKKINVIFEKDNLKETLGEVISEAGLTQVRIAETEKYPHVSFFFSGGQEDEFEDESRIMIPSPKVATYDLQPAMSAPKVTSAICEYRKSDAPDFICLNFANTDMVGHTGVYGAIEEAASVVDGCVKEIIESETEDTEYTYVIIADHGNSDFAINPDGTPNTAHSMNPVPIIIVDKDVKTVKNGTLRDVAPTILDLMGIDQPAEMTGSSLVN